ncbi:peptidoglycan DD-metalloendopeptidase family protein [Phenylobacterium sp. LjRoot219]|uniref:murein hydrolase activator EnvC family protein n=1 Tax=Phenylobacterium sp. LjRoot219 TaxID=3342283 RepID=UPI003ED01782
MPDILRVLWRALRARLAPSTVRSAADGPPPPLRRGGAAVIVGITLAAVSVAALAQGAGQLTRLNMRETELTAEQARNMSQLAQLLSVVEQLRRDPPPALLVSPQDARDAARAAILVKALTPELQTRARAYAREAGEMMRQRRLAAVANEALFTLESRRAEAAPAPEETSAALDAGGRPSGPLSAPERLATPVTGELVRRFGDPAPGGGRSSGLSYATVRGARVSSPAAGVVQYVGPVKGWGVILIFRLTGGYHLVLAGLAQATVAVGQSVAPGQPVGWMPDARQSSSELYLEIRERDAPVNPGRWMTQ